MRSFRKGVLTLTLAGLLVGCATSREANRITNTQTTTTQNAFETARTPETVYPASILQRSDDVYLGAKGIRSSRGQPLPPQLEAPRAVTIISAVPLTLYEVGAEITSATGIPVRIRITPPGEEDPVAVPQQASQGVQQANGDTPPMLASLPSSFGSLGAGPDTIQANWSGPLSGILNHVAAQFGLGWEFRDRQITFFKYRTRTYSILALPVDTTANAAISSGIASSSEDTEGSDTTSQTSQDLTAVSTIKIWQEIEDAIKTIVPEGAKLAVAPANGTVTVTAPDDALEAVEDYIQDRNKRLGRQVMIEVRVLAVDLNNADDYSLDLRAAFEDAAKSGLSIAGGPIVPAANALGELSVGIIDPQSKFNGSKALFKALSTQGKVSVVSETASTTLNNQLVPIQVATQTSFLKEVTVSQVADAGTLTSLKPGTVVTGFNMQLLPRIMGNSEVLLQYSLNISNLTALNEVSSGEQSIQIPEIDSRGFSQQSRLRSGSTLVLSGFRQDTASLDKEGVGDPGFFGLGGSNKAEHNNTVIVIMITPKVINLGS